MSVRPEKTYSPSVSLRFARRALVVQGDPGAALDRQRAGVGRELAGEHPQQRRLAGAVAAGEGHPFARLELEGDVLEQQLAADVDVQGGCGRDRHRPTNLENRRSGVTSAHGEARCDTSASWRRRGRRGAPPSAPTARRWPSWRRGRWRCRPGWSSSGSASPATASATRARRCSSTPTSRASPSATCCCGGRRCPTRRRSTASSSAPGETVGVLVGHTHFDHAVDAPAIARRFGCKAYGSDSLAT